RRRIKLERRDTDCLPGLQPVLRLGALAVHAQLAFSGGGLNVGGAQPRETRFVGKGGARTRFFQGARGGRGPGRCCRWGWCGLLRSAGSGWLGPAALQGSAAARVVAPVAIMMTWSGDLPATAGLSRTATAAHRLPPCPAVRARLPAALHLQDRLPVPAD